MCEYIFKNEGGCLKTTHCNIKYTVFVSVILMVLSCWFHFHQTVLGFVEGKAVSFLDFPATGSGYIVKTEQESLLIQVGSKPKMSFRENGGETRICDIMLTYCENDKEFGMKLAGEFY